MSKYILLDYSWLCKRSQASFRTLTSGGRPVGHIYGVLESIGRLLPYLEDTDTELLVCLDTKTYRADLVNSYKQNRGKSKVGSFNASVLRQDCITMLLPILCKHSKIRIVSKEGLEADDIIASLSINPKYSSCIVWGNDIDLYQSANITQCFQKITHGKPVLRDVNLHISIKHRKFFISPEQTGVPTLLISAKGKPSNSMRAGIPRCPKDILKRFALDRKLLSPIISYWKNEDNRLGTLDSEKIFYDYIYNECKSYLSAELGIDLPNVFLDNLYLTIPRICIKIDNKIIYNIEEDITLTSKRLQSWRLESCIKPFISESVRGV